MFFIRFHQSRSFVLYHTLCFLWSAHLTTASRSSSFLWCFSFVRTDTAPKQAFLHVSLRLVPSICSLLSPSVLCSLFRLLPLISSFSVFLYLLPCALHLVFPLVFKFNYSTTAFSFFFSDISRPFSLTPPKRSLLHAVSLRLVPSVSSLRASSIEFAFLRFSSLCLSPAFCCPSSASWTTTPKWAYFVAFSNFTHGHKRITPLCVFYACSSLGFHHVS